MASALILQFPQPPSDITLGRSGDAASFHQDDLVESYERGRVEGERALSEQLVRQRAEIVEIQTSVLGAIRGAFPQVAAECERALIALALEIARKLTAGSPISAEMIEAAVLEARAEMEVAAAHCVFLHPEDLQLLQHINSPLLLSSGSEEKVRFEASDKVGRGGCLIESRFGILDARRETKLALVEKELQP